MKPQDQRANPGRREWRQSPIISAEQAAAEEREDMDDKFFAALMSEKPRNRF